MRHGLCGAHRTGKTSLARMKAQQDGLSFAETTTTAVFHRHGLDPAAPMSFDVRLFIQDKILDEALGIWNGISGGWITDRTPVDFLAYTLSDIKGDTEVDYVQLENYTNRCFDVMNQVFDRLILIQPGIDLVYEPGKAALNKAYIEHFNVVANGILNDERLKVDVFVLPRNVLDLSERLRAIS